MTPAQRELARHALGLPNQARRSYRNRYFANAGGACAEQWQAMVAAGEAERGETGRRVSSLHFQLTRKGAELALDPRESLCPEDFPR